MKKHNKIIIVFSIIISAVLYAFHVIYDNKAHEIFMLMDISYNELMKSYSVVSSASISLFIIWIHLIAVYFFAINRKSLLKGLLHFVLIDIIIFVVSLCLEIILNYWRFEVSVAFMQFAVILVSAVLLYLASCAFYLLKKRIFAK